MSAIEKTTMMEDLVGSKRTGAFTISPSRDIYGELTFKGGKTSLYLEDKASFGT
jgi:hypothetical protein